jgi:hypothetical protein
LEGAGVGHTPGDPESRAQYLGEGGCINDATLGVPTKQRIYVVALVSQFTIRIVLDDHEVVFRCDVQHPLPSFALIEISLGTRLGRYLETIRRSRFDENPDPTDDDIRNYLAGNLCSCATYPEVLKAVKGAAELRDK